MEQSKIIDTLETYWLVCSGLLFCPVLFLLNTMSLVLWNILCWNIRGVNSEPKCLALRNKIDESNCSIVCLQETKKRSLIILFEEMMPEKI